MGLLYVGKPTPGDKGVTGNVNYFGTFVFLTMPRYVFLNLPRSSCAKMDFEGLIRNTRFIYSGLLDAGEHPTVQ